MAAIAAILGGMPATAQAQERPASIRQQTEEIRAIRELAEACNKRQQCLVSQGGARPDPQPQAPPGLPPVSPAIPVAPAPPSRPIPAPVADPVVAPVPVVASVVSPKLGGPITLADIRQEPPNALPQQQAGEKWKPVRVYTEVRSLPNATAFDVNAEVVTKGGIMSGVQYVTQLGSFTGENLKEIWKGSYTDTRLEFWAGIHGRSLDTQTRWSLVGFGRQLTHTDSGEGQSRPGTEYPYSYTWKNPAKPLTQLGGRARLERDLIQSKAQQLIIHVKAEVAATVSGQSGWAYDVQAGIWYRTAQVEAYGEVGDNNTGAYANGYGRYYLTKSGQWRPFGEVRGEVGTGYHNVQVGGGVQAGLGKNAYVEGVVSYNDGTSGNGMAATVRAGIRF